ncbi:Eukaryotic/viral aspartic protease, partial [Phytophthora megakarya]
GYARSANIKFERSGREAKEHDKHFLETCGDRELERQLTPLQLRDIHTLEDIVSDIQKVEKRVSNRSSSQSSSRRDDKRHSSSSGSYGRHDSRSRSQERSRIEQVHDFGKCEAFDELAKILRTNVDKKNISPELQKLVFVMIDVECLYAFTGKCESPENNNNNDENEKNVEFDGECGVCLDGGTLHEIKEDTTTEKVVNDDWLVSICEANEAAPVHAKTVKLLPGERMGWWSSQRFDRRVRMRALVHGAVNDEHGRQLEVQGIQEGKMSTTTRVKAKGTLGWNTVYEFECWVMDHSAGSEVVLGTDFMIPAGIRLDLFNATAKLPGEEMVPLVKSLSTDEDSAEGMHVTGGPTKGLQIPAGEWIEFRLQKRKPSLGTHDVWVRRIALIPAITRFRKWQPTLVRLTNITDKAVYCTVRHT